MLTSSSKILFLDLFIETRNNFILLRIICYLYTILFTAFSAFAQNPVKDFYLKKSLKQDGLHYQFTVLDDDKHGVWIYNKDKFYFWYKAQKVLSTQGGASGQLLNGSFEAFHENKQLAQKGKFHKGLKDGKWINWRADGSLISIEEWNKGDLCGTCEYFNEKGELDYYVKYGFFKTCRYEKDTVIVEKRFGPSTGTGTEKKKLPSTNSGTDDKKNSSTGSGTDESFFKRIFCKRKKVA